MASNLSPKPNFSLCSYESVVPAKSFINIDRFHHGTVMNESMLRLRKLIEHWAEHNDEHAARFEESAREAKEMGLTTAAENLRSAAKKAAEVSEHLRKALKSF